MQGPVGASREGLVVSEKFCRGAEVCAWSLQADEGLWAAEVEEIASAKVGRARECVQQAGAEQESREGLG